MVDYLSKRPMLLSAFAGCIICVLGLISKSMLLISGCLIIAFAAFAVIKKCKTVIFVVFVMLFALVISFLNCYKKTESIDKLSGREVTGEFIVVKPQKNYDDFCSTVVEVSLCEGLDNSLKIFTFYDYENLNCGDRINAKIKLQSIKNSEYKLNNYSESIYIMGNMTDISVKNGEEERVLKGIENIKKYITSTLFSNLGYREASTLTALIHGDNSYMTDEFNTLVKYAGVSHVMVVSGMHLTIIVAFFLSVSRKFFYNRYFKALIIFLTVVFMTSLCGFSKSILRAGVTYILSAFSIILNRGNNSENTLGTAVLLISIQNPFTVFNIGFQLSVLSTFGILVVAAPIIEVIKYNKIFKTSFGFWFASSVIISLSALILTLPVTIYVFGYVSTVALITNILIGEAVTVALSVSVLGLILNLILPLPSKAVFAIAGAVTRYINSVIELLGSANYAVLPLGKFAAYFAIALIIAVLSFLLACKKKNDMLKLYKVNKKIKQEGGGKLKWQ